MTQVQKDTIMALARQLATRRVRRFAGLRGLHAPQETLPKLEALAAKAESNLKTYLESLQ